MTTTSFAPLRATMTHHLQLRQIGAGCDRAPPTWHVGPHQAVHLLKANSVQKSGGVQGRLLRVRRSRLLIKPACGCVQWISPDKNVSFSVLQTSATSTFVRELLAGLFTARSAQLESTASRVVSVRRLMQTLGKMTDDKMAIGLRHIRRLPSYGSLPHRSCVCIRLITNRSF